MYKVLRLFFFFFFWLCWAARRILVPQPGIEPGPSAVKVQSPNPGPPGNSQGVSSNTYDK